MANALYVISLPVGGASAIRIATSPGTRHPAPFPTWCANLPAGGDPVWSAGLSGLLCLGNGTYQCVSFVRGAYSQVYPMRLTANAFDLWAVYATQPGWREIPLGVCACWTTRYS